MSRLCRVFPALLVVVLAGPCASASEVIPLGPSTTAIELDAAEDELVTLRVSEVAIDDVEIDGRRWAVVRVPEGRNLMERGRPSLPYLASKYLLGRTGGITLELVDRRLRNIDLDGLGLAGVAPSKGHFDRGTDPESVPWVFDDKIYSADDRYPATDADLGTPFIAGPLRGQAVRLPVAFWQPASNTLSVVEEARYRVVPEPEAANPRLGPERPYTGLFDAAARLNSLNYDRSRGRANPFVETGRLLIITDDAFLADVQPLADWSELVGYPTVVVPTSVAGATASAVKATIQSFYDEPESLAWIILVGDSAQIPTLTGVHTQHSPCDACFTKLEGTDNRPDAAISRISATTPGQVSAQVAKILAYEQLPDTGSAGVWYQGGFGIGSDDTGGTGLADWERIELLRTDLLDPAYSYTEFDQIYHSSATAGQVTTAVEDGRGLGLYIGHGWSGGWVTTGFDSSDANALVNGEMLPTIWSVACNNGEFTVGECFGEAWLRNPAGGAVSFEGGTTTESWVPPCDAQRGIVDALRLETAFTTGGQHMAGKHTVMDLHSDGDTSEGNKWVEQSVLFGACTTWMRTLPAVAPDEPDDFTAAAGIASLTVEVAGAPLAKAGAAMVSFYTDDGGIEVVGSGLIDGSGVVNAAVSADPTHCHIHGQNLIPSSFELAAREAGRVSLDGAAYGCGDTVAVRVADSNIPGSSPLTIDTTTVELAGGGATHTVVATEIAADRSIYTGTAVLGSDLTVGHGDLLTATYIDADDGQGGSNIPRTAGAAIDCAGPVVGDLAVSGLGANEVTVSWTTDEPGTSWAQITPGGAIVTGDTLTTSHELEFTGLDPCTTFTVTVASTDALGNPGAGSATPPFTTWMQSVAFADDVEEGPGGWVVDTVQDPGADPNWGIVTDPATSSPTHSWFTSDEGNVKDDRLEAGPFSLGGGSPVLTFWHHFETEANYDGGVLEVSTDGMSWQDIEAAGGVFLAGGYNDDVSSWSSNPLAGRNFWAGTGPLQQVVVDLTPFAGGDLWIRFRLGCDSSVADEGWWIDDIVIETTAPCDGLFTDGFESGDCGRWATVVGEE